MGQVKSKENEHSMLPPPNLHHSHWRSCCVSFSPESSSILQGFLVIFYAMVPFIVWQSIGISCQNTVLNAQNKISRVTKKSG